MCSGGWAGPPVPPLDPPMNLIISFFSETEGRALETEMNQKGPGEAFFVRCDMSKEDDVKVITFL